MNNIIGDALCKTTPYRYANVCAADIFFGGTANLSERKFSPFGNSAFRIRYCFFSTHYKMFTGIVEYMGTVVAVSENDTTESGGNGWTVTVGDATCILDDCHIGDSIAINGTGNVVV